MTFVSAPALPGEGIAAPVSVVVEAVVAETPVIRMYVLAARDGSALPDHEPGAHIDVIVPDLPVRQYSLIDTGAHPGRYVIAVLRDPASRGGSQGIHDRLAAGIELAVSAPRNHFRLGGRAERHILVAGGIGVTPILSMARKLQAEGTPFELHYCCRSRDQAAFLPMLAEAPFAQAVHLHFDDEGPAQRFSPRDLLAGAGTAEVYMCGPTGFMDWVRAEAEAAGFPAAQVHVEHFAPAAAPVAGGAFQIVVASTGEVVDVPEDKSALIALEEAGYDIPMSCEQGICGSCVTRILEGEALHNDSILDEHQREVEKLFTPCCSRARTARLVVDL